jgi:hypothetical protein
MRARDRISRIAGGWRGDALVALGLSAFLLVFLAVQGLLHGAKTCSKPAARPVFSAASSCGAPTPSWRPSRRLSAWQ